MRERRDARRRFEERHGPDAARDAEALRDHVSARTAADRLYGDLPRPERVLFDPLHVND